MPITDKLYNAAILICLCSGFISRILGVSELRYLQYIGLAVGPVLCLIYGVKRLRIVPSQVICYIVLICFGSLSCLDMEFTKVSYLMFWLSAVLLFLPYHKFEVRMGLINLVFAVTQLARIESLNLDLSWMAFLKSSASSAETNGPTFVFALFFIYQLYKGNKWLCALNLVCSVIFFKRIALIAMMVCILIFLFRKYMSKERAFAPLCGANLLVIICLLNILYVFGTVLFVNGFFADMIRSTGVSVGELTMGRNTLYKYVVKDFLNSDIFQFLFGHGTASCISLLNRHGIHDDLHNDVFKILYEYGAVIFLLFFYFLYRNANTWYRLSLSVMVNVFFLSDNTLIYASVIITFFLVSHENLGSQRLMPDSIN